MGKLKDKTMNIKESINDTRKGFEESLRKNVFQTDQ